MRTLPVTARFWMHVLLVPATVAPVFADESAHATVFELPTDGSAVIGTDTTITTRYEDTLLDIARRYSLGYDEIIRANPGVDMWIPGEGTRITLPGRRILPPGPREGVGVDSKGARRCRRSLAGGGRSRTGQSLGCLQNTPRLRQWNL